MTKYFKKTFVCDSIVSNAFSQCISSKLKSDQLFHLVDSSMINYRLEKLMKGLTAKVFRTCHASRQFSSTLQSSFTGCPLSHYKAANIKVAKMCNHMRFAKCSKKFVLCPTTSKTNYLDPRITYAFCKKHNVDPLKLVSSHIHNKSVWAHNTSASFSF